MDNSVEKKLDTILNKLQTIEERLEKVEKDVKDVHQYVPFVGWLEEQGKKMTGPMSYISYLSSVPKLIWRSNS